MKEIKKKIKVFSAAGVISERANFNQLNRSKMLLKKRESFFRTLQIIDSKPYIHFDHYLGLCSESLRVSIFANIGSTKLNFLNSNFFPAKPFFPFLLYVRKKITLSLHITWVQRVGFPKSHTYIQRLKAKHWLTKTVN